MQGLRCKYCGSSILVRYGKYKDTQLYWCQACKRKFKGRKDLFHMKVPAEYVASALDSYYRGLSIGDISEHLAEKYDYLPSKHVISDWVVKFTARAIKFFEAYRPQVGVTWIANETVLVMGRRRTAWLWDIIDARTRYLLATRVSYTHSDDDARALIEQACREARKGPEVLITDELASHFNSVRLSISRPTDDGDWSAFEIKDSTVVERCHGKMKERTKIVRAFRDIDTIIRFNDGFRIYYNYLKPLEVLKGRTPAEAANIFCGVKEWVDVTKLLFANSDRPVAGTMAQVLLEGRSVASSEAPPLALDHAGGHGEGVLHRSSA